MPGNNDEAAEKIEKPHYHGHRARLRQRFLEAGSEAVSAFTPVHSPSKTGVERL